MKSVLTNRASVRFIASLVKKVGQNKGAPRVWIEGAAAERAGFKPGAEFDVSIDQDRSMVRLSLSAGGIRIVSKKARGSREVPVIDLNSHELLSIYEGIELVAKALASATKASSTVEQSLEATLKQAPVDESQSQVSGR